MNNEYIFLFNDTVVKNINLITETKEKLLFNHTIEELKPYYKSIQNVIKTLNKNNKFYKEELNKPNFYLFRTNKNMYLKTWLCDYDEENKIIVEIVDKLYTPFGEISLLCDDYLKNYIEIFLHNDFIRELILYPRITLH